MATTNEQLDAVSKQAMEEHFKLAYQDNTRSTLDEALGMAIAVYSDWVGSRIFEIFAAALEDANYHDEAEIVRNWVSPSPLTE